ncbi:ABC transporter permease [Candidatus Bathyarchaeota archaeon]|nr:ABC transporter permease [Candidatus Bathyarchaeota archaeon]
MNLILEGLIKAFWLIASFDQEVYSIMFLTLRVSGTAVAIGALIGIPLGAGIGLKDFFGKRFLISVINTLMGLPPVVVGLFVYLILSTSGPLGALQLLYTPTAMIIAQLIMVVPIVVGVTISSVSSIDKTIRDKALSLGATKMQLIITILKEAKAGFLTAVIAAFGGAISEVGAVMIVGGNIRWATRVLTTAIVIETELGKFDVAIALGVILLLLAFIINWVLTQMQWSGLKR